MWEHGLLVHVPRGVVARQAALRPGREHGRRAARCSGGCWSSPRQESRFTVIEEYASVDAGARRLLERASSEIVVGDAAKVEYVSVQNLSQRTWHFASHHATVGRDAELDWVAGGLRLGEGQGVDPERPRGPGRDVAGHRRVLRRRRRSISTTTRTSCTSAPDTTSDFAFKGALRDTARAVWRGMIRVEEGAQKTNAYQENRNLLLSKTAHAELDPRPRDPRQRRALHARRDARPGRPRAALLPHGARPLARRGGAADRARASSRTCSTASSWSPCGRRSAPRSRPAFRRAEAAVPTRTRGRCGGYGPSAGTTTVASGAYVQPRFGPATLTR